VAPDMIQRQGKTARDPCSTGNNFRNSRQSETSPAAADPKGARPAYSIGKFPEFAGADLSDRAVSTSAICPSTLGVIDVAANAANGLRATRPDEFFHHAIRNRRRNCGTYNQGTAQAGSFPDRGARPFAEEEMVEIEMHPVAIQGPFRVFSMEPADALLKIGEEARPKKSPPKSARF